MTESNLNPKFVSFGMNAEELRELVTQFGAKVPEVHMVTVDGGADKAPSEDDLQAERERNTLLFKRAPSTQGDEIVEATYGSISWGRPEQRYTASYREALLMWWRVFNESATGLFAKVAAPLQPR